MNLGVKDMLAKDGQLGWPVLRTTMWMVMETSTFGTCKSSNKSGASTLRSVHADGENAAPQASPTLRAGSRDDEHDRAGGEVSAIVLKA